MCKHALSVVGSILNTDFTYPVDFNTTPATPCTVLETWFCVRMDWFLVAFR